MIKTEFKDENVVNDYENKKLEVLIPFLSNTEYLIGEIIDIDYLGDILEIKNIITEKIGKVKVEEQYINWLEPRIGDYYCRDEKLMKGRGRETVILKENIKNYMISPNYYSHNTNLF
jgi:hypothetical protein